MRLSIREIAKDLDIKEPRYHDMVLMLAKYKIDKPGRHNIITVLKGAHAGKYYIDTRVANIFPLEPNGKIMCYCVPIDMFQVYEGRERDI